MPIETTINKEKFTCDGVITAFDFTFRLNKTDHLTIQLETIATGAAETITSGVTVTINSTGIGGTVTFDTAPADTKRLFVIRKVPLTQTLNIKGNSRLPFEQMTDTFDLIVMMIQQHNEQLSRTFQQPELITGTLPTLPSLVEGRALVGDANGNLKNSTINLDSIPDGGKAQKVEDSAGTTAVHTEKNSGEKKVRIETDGVERAVIDENGLALKNSMKLTLAGNLDLNGAEIENFYLSSMKSDANSANLANFFAEHREGAYITRVDKDTLRASVGRITINGKLCYNASAITLDVSSIDDGHWYDLYAEVSGSGFTLVAKDADATIGSTSASTDQVRIASFQWLNATTGISAIYEYFPGEILGWDWMLGDGDGDSTKTVNLGVTMDTDHYYCLPTYRSRITSADPGDMGDITGNPAATVGLAARSSTTTSFLVYAERDAGSWSSSDRLVFNFYIRGAYT